MHTIHMKEKQTTSVVYITNGTNCLMLINAERVLYPNMQCYAYSYGWYEMSDSLFFYFFFWWCLLLPISTQLARAPVCVRVFPRNSHTTLFGYSKTYTINGVTIDNRSPNVSKRLAWQPQWVKWMRTIVAEQATTVKITQIQWTQWNGCMSCHSFKNKVRVLDASVRICVCVCVYLFLLFLFGF